MIEYVSSKNLTKTAIIICGDFNTEPNSESIY